MSDISSITPAKNTYTSIYTGAASGSTDGTTGTDATKDRNAVDKDMFLRLLVTQLKYQDPLNPSNPDDFLAQTAQFTTVEKLTQLATDMSKVALGQRMASASALIGKEVSYLDDGNQTVTGVVQSARIDDADNLLVKLANGKELSLLEVKSIADHTTTTTTT